MSARTIDATEENFQSLFESEKPVLLDFWAQWCGPCKMMMPLIEAIADERDDLTVVKVNIDDLPKIASQLGVRGIPTLMLVRNGDIRGTKIGALPRSQLTTFIDQNI